MAGPTLDQATALQTAYDHFNQKLFTGQLSNCMVTFSRNANIIAGYYSPAMWESETSEGQYKIAEIAINVNLMKHTDMVEFYLTLVHEMLHHWQEEAGTAGAEGYHNKEYAEAAWMLGLRIDNGNGGATGKSVTQTMVEGSAVEQAIRTLPESAIIPWESSELHLPDAENPGGGTEQMPKDPGKPETQPKGTRSKYSCPLCGLNAWAKPDVILICGKDSKTMVERKV